ncbi:MAG: hypothetical protein C0510_06885 [Erythrobacter sp.]|nr:hypothetical protein [Erythrobacter sp.]
MAINFLQRIGNAPMPAPSMPVPQPAPPLPPMTGNLQRMTQGPQGAPDQAGLANILEAIGGAPAAPAVMPQQQAPESPRKRRSFLETLGRVSDVIAQVGGADPLYQPTLDAREDRTRAIDLDALRKQIVEQQIAQGQQTIAAGDIELADSERARLGQALGAIATNPEAIGMWSQIAAEAGIDEQRAAQIGGLLQQNPDLAPALAQSLGWSPSTNGKGSQAKELQIYGLLLKKGTPEMAQAYLQSLTNPDAITDYQKAQLALSMQELGLKTESEQFDREVKAEELDIKRGGGNTSLTPKQRGDITMKLKLLPAAQQQFARVQELYNKMVQEGTFARGALGGLLPGQVAGGTAEEFDKAVGALRKSILSMTRVPGIGSMSNYETMLDEAALPARWGSDEGRAEAIRNIGTLLQNYEAGYRDMLGTAAAPRRTPPARRQPARSQPGSAPAPAPRRSMSPAAIEARRRGLIQ